METIADRFSLARLNVNDEQLQGIIGRAGHLNEVGTPATATLSDITFEAWLIIKRAACRLPP
ncbi:MAG: hypothetical protein M3362_03750 [Acidobacteriota bacterium]|nr:hypothetical protein [Acidobacteriota bacterium]